MLSPEPRSTSPVMLTLPVMLLLDGCSVSAPPLTLPTTLLPDASVNEVLAVMLPVTLTGVLVVMVVPEIGPMMVTLDEIATVPVEVSEPVILVVEPVPIFIDAAVMLAVMVCACAPIENAPLVLSVPPLTAVGRVDAADVQVAAGLQRR